MRGNAEELRFRAGAMVSTGEWSILTDRRVKM
jgi:hypothetical protein